MLLVPFQSIKYKKKHFFYNVLFPAKHTYFLYKLRKIPYKIFKKYIYTYMYK